MSFKVFKRMILAFLCVIIAGAFMLLAFSGINFGRSMFETCFMEITYEEAVAFARKVDNVETGLALTTGAETKSLAKDYEYFIDANGKEEVLNWQETENVSRVQKVEDKLQMYAKVTENECQGGIKNTSNNEMFYKDGVLYNHQLKSIETDYNGEEAVVKEFGEESKTKYAMPESYIMVQPISLLQVISECKSAGYDATYYKGYDGKNTIIKVEFGFTSSDDYGSQTIEATTVFVYNIDNEVIGIKELSSMVMATENYKNEMTVEGEMVVFDGAIEFPQDLNSYVENI
ncbi:MAG: hypothetical protein IJY57_01185 [Clostridia bacterium]|nr:hypothetical protein [Clostridia bacterium]